MSTLGRLEQVTNLRSQWPDEARHFTPWLAQDENLALIGEALGFGNEWLERIEVEASVGSFSADILCQDTGAENSFVIIENQFGPTDHDHLGKLLTYAAGREAKTVIWIAERIRDEHRAAIDLLNSATNDDFQFFALEIELWRIADSPVAPRFNVIAKPNNWSRHVKRVRSSEGLSDLKKQYIRYWEAFATKLSEADTPLRPQKAGPRQWMNLSIGRSGFNVTASLNNQRQHLQATLEVFHEDADEYFDALSEQQEEIESSLGFNLNWQQLPKRKSARIGIKKSDTNPTDETDWPAQHAWLVSHLTALHSAFHDRVKALDATP